MEKYLILVAGLPGVGKSSFMHLLQENLSNIIKNNKYIYPVPQSYIITNGTSFTVDPFEFVELRIQSIADIEKIKQLKSEQKESLITIYIDRGPDFDHSLRIVQSPNYAESGLYIPPDYIQKQKSIYDLNRHLFDFTIVNDRSPEWMLEQGATFILSRINKTEKIFEDGLLLDTGLREKITLKLIKINAKINQYFAEHPNEIHKLHSREFENLIAGLLFDMGYEVELTKETHDGGFDIKAVKNDEFGPLLYLVECKKNSPDRPVGVEIIRQLDSVKRLHDATKSILVTTSYFSPDAKELKRMLGYQMELKEFKDIVTWLSKYK